MIGMEYERQLRDGQALIERALQSCFADDTDAEEDEQLRHYLP